MTSQCTVSLLVIFSQHKDIVSAQRIAAAHEMYAMQAVEEALHMMDDQAILSRNA